MIPRKYGWIIQSLLMSISMGFLMSIVMTLINIGFSEQFFIRWPRAFAVGICVAIPTGLIVGPLARKLTEKITTGKG